MLVVSLEWNRIIVLVLCPGVFDSRQLIRVGIESGGVRPSANVR